MSNDQSGNVVERMDEQLSGGYFYGGDGDWSRINDVADEGGEITISTTRVSYESVPHTLREEAYELYDGSGEVIVHEDDIDLVRSTDTRTGQ